MKSASETHCGQKSICVRHRFFVVRIRSISITISLAFFVSILDVGDFTQVGQQPSLSRIKRVKERVAADHQFCPAIMQPMKLALNSEPLNVCLTGFEESGRIGKADQPDKLLANRAQCTVAQPNAHAVDV